jgi:predicted glutamine amidotransferase
MCRLLGWVAREGLSLRDVLGEESFVAFAQLSRIHADGWGLAYAEGDALEVERSTTNASADPAFTKVATAACSRAGLAHLRWASPGLPVELCNAHPFRYDGYAFAHNGGVYPFERIGELLDDEWRARLTGSTDSEHYFLAVMAEMADSGDDLPTALPRVLRRITERYTPSSLNAMILGPDALYVVNCHDDSVRPVLPPPEEQSVDELVESTEEEVPYYDLRYRLAGDSVVVASSGFAQPEGGGWRRIENNALLVVDRRTLEVTEIPLEVEIGLAAAAESAGADLR